MAVSNTFHNFEIGRFLNGGERSKNLPFLLQDKNDWAFQLVCLFHLKTGHSNGDSDRPEVSINFSFHFLFDTIERYGTACVRCSPAQT